MDPPVSLRDVGVRFRVPRRSRLGKAPRLIGAGKWTLWGLDGVTFGVARGEVLGLIGPNGAGKSTLLRVVAGIFRPDRGTIAVRGRVTPFLTPSAGLSASLSGWENIELGAVLLGLSRNEARRIAPEIADFTGLGEFLDAPIATYSSGMSARLGFALAAFTDPEILVLDEVLGAGDQEFRERSTAKIRELIRAGSTVLMASHVLPTLTELCDRLVRLERGRVVDDGDPGTVADRYVESLHREGKVAEIRRMQVTVPKREPGPTGTRRP